MLRIVRFLCDRIALLDNKPNMKSHLDLSENVSLSWINLECSR